MDRGIPVEQGPEILEKAHEAAVSNRWELGREQSEQDNELLRREIDGIRVGLTIGYGVVGAERGESPFLCVTMSTDHRA